MSSSTYVRLAVVVALMVTGCGAASASRTSSIATHAPPIASSNSSAGPNWPCLARFNARETTTADGVPVAQVGQGRAAVVLSNESDQDVCGWVDFLPALLRSHHAITLYDFVSEPVGNLESVVRFVRAGGARTVTLIGASEGAKASIIAAERARPDGVVSLSAEAELAGRPVAPSAVRLRAPTLFVTALEDPYGSTSATRSYFRSAPSPAKRLVTVPGSEHGTALLGQASVRRAVLGFLAAHGA